jgi:hypothetical protein
METQAKNDILLNSSSNVLNFKLRNVSTTATYNMFEMYVNVTGSPGSMNIYYCNSSYTTGVISSSNSCAVFATLNNTIAYNHSHGVNSYHIVKQLPVNSGNIGSVKMTTDSVFAISGAIAAGEWIAKVIPNITRIDDVQLSTNSGNTYTNVSSSMDFHIHQYFTGDSYCYYNSVADGGYYNTSMRCDAYDFDPLAPGLVTFYSPLDPIYNNSILINYSESVPSPGTSISRYIINLCNPDSSLNTSIINNTLNLTYTLNLLTLTDGNYSVCVDTFNNFSQSSRSYSRYFIIDKVTPDINFIVPSIMNNTIAYSNESFTTDIRLFDDNLFSYSCEVYDSNNDIHTVSNATGINTTNYTIAMTFTPNLAGQWKIICNASDGHTAKDIKNYVYDISDNKNIDFKFEKIKPNKEYDTKNISIRFAGGDADISKVTLIKQKDRYSFNYELDKRPVGTELRMIYRIECEDLYYISGSQYPAHHVCAESGKWIDFVSPDLVKYQVKPCGKDCSEITLITKNRQYLNFSSIGDLNQNTGTAFFNVTLRPERNDTVLDFGVCPDTIEGQISLWMTCALCLGLMILSLMFGLWILGFLSGLGWIFWSAIFYGCQGMISVFIGLVAALFTFYFLIQMMMTLSLAKFRR